MNAHYTDLDDILATGETVHCVFELTVKHMGYINPSTDDEDLKKGTHLDLPFWLAQKLKNDEKATVVSVDIPKQYRKAYLQVYQADPHAVDLQSLGPHFYSFALKMSLLDQLQSRDIISGLLKLYQSRFQSIMDSAQHATYKEGISCTSKFDCMERNLFQVGQIGLREMKQWRIRDTARIAQAGVVQRHGKRKRQAEEDD